MRREFSKAFLGFLLILSVVLLAMPAAELQAAKRPKINIKKLSLTKNETYTLRVYNVKKRHTIKFASDDATIASVDSRSSKSKRTVLVTAENVGTTTIRANIYNRKGRLTRTLKTNVRVTPYAISLKFTQKNIKIKVSDTAKLAYIIKPNTAQEVPIFESSDENVATVNSKGIITAVAPGNTTITATLLSNGQKATCTIQVLPDEEDDAEDTDERSDRESKDR